MDRKALKDAAKVSVDQAKGNPKTVTLICLGALLVLVLSEWGLTRLIDSMNTHSHYLSQSLSAETRSYVLMMVVSLVCQLAAILVTMGYASFALALSRGKAFSPDTLLDGFRLWSRTILLYLYTSVLLSLWATLLSMPVSYLLSALYLTGAVNEEQLMMLLLICVSLVMFLMSYRYRMAWFLFLDDPAQPIAQVITRAKLLTKTHRFQLFLLDLSFLPWFLLCLLTCGVLLIWKMPYFAATYAHAYQRLLEDADRRQKHMEEVLEQQRQWLEQNRFR